MAHLTWGFGYGVHFFTLHLAQGLF
jgi:hypothetical protein